MPPIRNYACRRCGRQFRLEQLPKEPDLKVCPRCQQDSLYRTETPARYPEGGGQQLIVNPANKKR